MPHSIRKDYQRRTKMNTLERLKKVLDNVFEGEIDSSSLTEASSLSDDVGMNSIGMLYMAMGIEQEFGVRLTNADLPELITVGDLIRKVEEKQK
ncbi:MAG: acyl carrier protein [Ruminococcaceae bacterium]|nr:acyl carrier protein [Oscillospiraceae bacterium]